MERLTDEQLVERVREGDGDAFRELIERHERYIYTLIIRMVGHPQTAEDLAQEVFIKLYRSIDAFRGDAKLTTWLYRLAVHTAADYRRSRSRRPLEALVDRIRGWFASPNPQPEEQFLAQEERESMQMMVAELPDKYKLVVYLYHYRQMSYKEIADITGLPVKTVETRLYRGKTMLKNKWTEANGHETASKRTAAPAVPE
jgi:RNA polymerase sigma-70 factor (ECF subfamily)